MQENYRAGPAHQDQILPIEQQAIEQISLKIICQPFDLEIKVIVKSPDKKRRDFYFNQVSSGIEAVFKNINTLKKADREKFNESRDYRLFHKKEFSLLILKLQDVFRPPTFFTTAEGIKWSNEKQHPIPPNVYSTVPFLGVGVYRNETRTVGIDPLARTHHILLMEKLDRVNQHSS